MTATLHPDPRPPALAWLVPEPPVAMPALPLDDVVGHPAPLPAEPVPPEVPALARGVVEVLLGRRAVDSLRTRLTDRTARAVTTRRTLHGGRLASLRCQVRADVAEVCVRVATPRTSHALALRLELRGRRWVVTALEG